MEEQAKKTGSFNQRPKKSGFKGRVNDKIEKEFSEKMIDLARVVRVAAGGKKFSFRATMVVGDKKGRIGIGVGKGKDVAKAIMKAKAIAEKNVVKLPLVGNTINHEVSSKYGSAKVILKPASLGHGLVAGGSVRVVCNLVGIKDISAKILGTTSNKLNNARATLIALKKMRANKVTSNSV